MNTEDYNLMLDTLRGMGLALQKQVDNLQAENRNIRQRLTCVESKLIRNGLHDRPTEADTDTVSLPKVTLED
ncbi:MAG: hypothetical protein GY906_24555 [bacterium]|nr:hypothetical protein [bacterium]